MSMITFVNKAGNEAVIHEADAATIAHYKSMGYAVKGSEPEAEAAPKDADKKSAGAL